MDRNSQPEQPSEPATSRSSHTEQENSPDYMHQSTYDNPIDVRAPLQPLAKGSTAVLPTALMMTAGERQATLPFSSGTPYWLPEEHVETQLRSQIRPPSQPQIWQTEPPEVISESLEMEDATIQSTSRGTSWALRLPWFQRKRIKKEKKPESYVTSSVKTTNGDAVYYGGLMKTASPSSLSVEAGSAVAMETGQLHSSTPRHLQNQQLSEQAPERQKSSSSDKKRSNSTRHSKHNQHHLLSQQSPPPPPPLPVYEWSDNPKTLLPALPEHSNTNKVFRNRSWISTSSEGSRHRNRRNASDEDSLADFNEAEWTPQDSAYGAAIPICGWVPKRLRQFIEATLIVVIAVALIYLVVTTSIALSEHKSSKHVSHHQNDNETSTNSGVTTYNNGLQVDDDYYIEYRNNNNGDDNVNNSNNDDDDGDDFVNYNGGDDNMNYRENDDNSRYYNRYNGNSNYNRQQGNNNYNQQRGNNNYNGYNNGG